ncbi:hypothetical protein [Candidatus Lokiarchaeum ossiferum]|uniref:hypothetical protein n=1 Tax=Candidatus Lokiarchaeum ossiferum TaxID=2951803 RepID=UPI00352D9ECC
MGVEYINSQIETILKNSLLKFENNKTTHPDAHIPEIEYQIYNQFLNSRYLNMSSHRKPQTKNSAFKVDQVHF